MGSPNARASLASTIVVLLTTASPCSAFTPSWKVNNLHPPTKITSVDKHQHSSLFMASSSSPRPTLQIPNPFDSSNEDASFTVPEDALFAMAVNVMANDLGVNNPSLLDEDFMWIGPGIGRPLSKEDYLAAGKFFDLRSAFPDLDYQAHDFRIDSRDPNTVRLTARTVGTMRGELRLRKETLPPNGKRMVCPPEAISMTFDPSKGTLKKLCSGFCLDRLVGNTRGLCGVRAAAVIAGDPPSEWDIYPPLTVVQRFFGRSVKQLDDPTAFLAPFPETVMVQLAKGVIAADNGASDPDLLGPSFTFCGPIVGPIQKDDFVKAFGNFNIKEALPDLRPEFTHFRVDPYDPYRVWVDTRATGTRTGSLGGSKPTFEKYDSPPEAASFTFDDDGFCIRLTAGAVMDPSIGNTGGLGGVFGIFYATGTGLPGISVRPIAELFGRLRTRLLQPLTGVGVDEYKLPTKEDSNPFENLSDFLESISKGITEAPSLAPPAVSSKTTRVQQASVGVKRPQISPPKASPPPPPVKKITPVPQSGASAPVPMKRSPVKKATDEVLKGRQEREERFRKAQDLAAEKEKKRAEQLAENAKKAKEAAAERERKREEMAAAKAKLEQEKKNAEEARRKADEARKAERDEALRAMREEQAKKAAEAQKATVVEKQRQTAAADQQEVKEKAAAAAAAVREKAAAAAKERAEAKERAAAKEREAARERAAEAAKKRAGAAAAAAQERALAAAAAAKERAAAAAAAAKERAEAAAAAAKERAAAAAAAKEKAAAERAKRQEAAAAKQRQAREAKEAREKAAAIKKALAESKPRSTISLVSLFGSDDEASTKKIPSKKEEVPESKPATSWFNFGSKKSDDPPKPSPSSTQKVIRRPTLNLAPRPTLNISQRPTKNIAPRPSKTIAQRPTKNIAQRPSINIARRPTKTIIQRPTKDLPQRPTKSLAQRATQSLFFATPQEEKTAPPPKVKRPVKKSKKPPKNVPSLTNWRRNRDGSVTGKVVGSTLFSRGEEITTSPIRSGELKAGSLVRTASGSKYYLK